MLNLLQIEFKKIIPYRTFWIITLLYFTLIPIILYGIGEFKLEGTPVTFESTYTFPHIWNVVTYIASWFNLLLIGLLIIILISNEFKYKTFRQHVIDGQSRLDLMKGKVLIILTFATVSTLYLFLLAIIFGFSYTEVIEKGIWLTDIKYLFIYFAQTVGYMAVALLIGVLIRSSSLAIILFIFSIFIEGIIRFIMGLIINNPYIKNFFPMKIIANLTPFPIPKDLAVEEMNNLFLKNEISLQTSLFIAIVYILIFSFISCWILRTKDLK